MAARLGAQNTPAVCALVKHTPRAASRSMFGVMALGRDSRHPTKSFMSSTARKTTLGGRSGVSANNWPTQTHVNKAMLKRRREGIFMSSRSSLQERRSCRLRDVNFRHFSLIDTNSTYSPLGPRESRKRAHAKRVGEGNLPPRRWGSDPSPPKVMSKSKYSPKG